MSTTILEKKLAIAEVVVNSALAIGTKLKALKSPRKKSFKRVYNRRPKTKQRTAVAMVSLTFDAVMSAVSIARILSQPTPKYPSNVSKIHQEKVLD